MALKRVAHIDPNGVYLGMVEVDEADFTDRHLPQIQQCDLKPLEYRWIADAASAYGGCFDPLPLQRRPKEGGVPSSDQAMYAYWRARQSGGEGLPVDTTRWMAWYETTLEGQQQR